jgi:hypothetical protein
VIISEIRGYLLAAMPGFFLATNPDSYRDELKLMRSPNPSIDLIGFSS